MLLDELPHLLGAFIVEAGGADDHVDALAEAPADVLHDGVGVGEIDDDLRVCDVLLRIACVGAARVGHAVGRFHGANDLCAHLSVVAEYSNSNAHTSLSIS